MAGKGRKMSLLPKSFAPLFSRYLFATGILIAFFFFVHFQVLGRTQREIESKESTWRSERPKIGRLAFLKGAQEDLTRFKETLPEEAVLPELVSFISELAAKYHLTIPTISYQPQKTDAPGVAKIIISFTLKGEYREIRKFLYEIEKSRYFLIIETMVLASSVKEGEKIQLQLQVAAYLRPTAPDRKEPRPET